MRLAPSRVRALCSGLMMSPRSPSARKLASASGARTRTAGPAGFAKPRRASVRMRPIRFPAMDRARQIPLGPQIDNAVRRPRFPGKRPIECGPAFGCRVRLKALASLELRTRAKFAHDKVAGAGAQAHSEIPATDDEVGTIIGTAPHEDVNVRILCIRVVDRHQSSRVPGSREAWSISSRLKLRRLANSPASSGETMNLK